ncbi:putative mitochondrial protein [Sesamum angolense]|uniref:Mitochondrial protein n=1 Tax=Sesamum angolense TaxID=2727404 RepID=A0AAE1W1X7_9LAMI|nr:putative mitochondrial protein [Sesamum angolense]
MAAFRSKRAIFAALKDRIWKRIHGWQEKILSQTGKTLLIHTVVQAISSYAMSCFLLPKTLLMEFQTMAADFFWHDGERRKIHWLAWNKLCSTKLDGGLGFRNLEAINLALLAKQLWRLLTQPDYLVSKVLKAKYFPRNHLFDAKVGTLPSYTWCSIIAAHELLLSGCSIIAARELLLSGCRWRIGIGHSIDGMERSICKFPVLARGLGCHFPDFAQLLEGVGCHGLALFKLGSGKHWPSQVWRAVWQAKIPNKVKVFSWRAICGILPTTTCLQQRLPLVPFSCPFCDTIEETVLHSLLRCTFARQVWAVSNLRCSGFRRVCLVCQSLRLERIGSTLVAEAYAARANSYGLEATMARGGD